MRALLTVLLAAAVAMPAMAEIKPYPSAIRKVYVASCNSGEDAASLAYCECSLTELEKRWDYATFMKKMDMSEEQLFDDKDFGDAMAACVQHI